jgi:hypothetical protein
MSKTNSKITLPSKALWLVERTSQRYDSEEAPCEGAAKSTRVIVDTRLCDDPKKIPANKGKDGDWYLQGINHRVENGKIKRDLGVKAFWTIKLTSLKQLQEFIQKHGDCVVGEEDGYNTIEIYDDYRE